MNDITQVINSMELDDITSEIKRTMRRSARDAVQLGYMIRRILEEKLWYPKYESYDEYLNVELNMEYTMATRFININKKYSVLHNSMEISNIFESYTQGALIEMLNMSQEEMEQVTPDMTVRQIREIKQQSRPNKQKTEKEDFTEPQIAGQLRMEDTGMESPRTYKDNDELEPKDAELIRFLVVHAVDDNAITYEDVSDLESLYGKLCTHTVYNDVHYYLSAESQSNPISEEKTGFAVVAYEEDIQHPFIFVENSYLVKIVMKELRERRNMCCYNTDACTYAEGSRLHSKDDGLCKSTCCMSCEDLENCGYRCRNAAHAIQEQDSEKVATSQPDYEQVNTGLECDWEDPENDEEEMEIITDIQEQEEAETLTVPVDLDIEDDVIDGEFRELETEEIQIAAAVTEEEKSEQFSAYGLEKTVYPEGSTLSTLGCGHKHYCFDCAQECGIRQEERYCCYAPLGNPFRCDTMDFIEKLRKEVGEACQFVDNSKAYHTEGSKEAVPCCMKCSNPCNYLCKRAEIQREEDAKYPDGDKEQEVSAQKVLDDMNARLNMMLTTPEQFGTRKIEQQKIIVAALASMVCDLQNMELEKELKQESEAFAQPDLPELKNNDRRKEWLEAYKDWGIWYHDENIDVNYYKYDFSDGSRLIVSEYPDRECYWKNETEVQVRYHFLEKGKKKYNGKTAYDEKYRESPNSITELVEWLKNLQKKK